MRRGMKAVVTTVVALVFSVTTASDGQPTRSIGVICSVDADGNPELQVHDAPRSVFAD